MNAILAQLSLLLPDFLFTPTYRTRRIALLLADPKTCDHEWMIVGKSQGGIRVHCFRCLSDGEVSPVSESERAQAFGALNDPKPWPDATRVTLSD